VTRMSRLLVAGLVLAIGVSLAATTDLGDWLPGRRAVKEQTARPWPRSMAAIGDSITQAVDVASPLNGPWAAHNWATGRDPRDAVVSHYERIRSEERAISGAAFNLSVAGARMRDAPRQARLAVARHVDYVTLLLGANDVCAPTLDSMTPVDSFRRSFNRAMETLTGGLPDSTIYVVSIPNVYRLWDVLHRSPAARAAWRTFGICQALLSEQRSERERRLVQSRVESFNRSLEGVCAAHPGCYFDHDVVYSYRFTAGDVSKIDFFHPSLSGQRQLARLTWRAGPLTP
jgi:lysophospholipase L1-like esterase